jgi:hypothetical protein
MQGDFSTAHVSEFLRWTQLQKMKHACQIAEKYDVYATAVIQMTPQGNKWATYRQLQADKSMVVAGTLANISMTLLE